MVWCFCHTGANTGLPSTNSRGSNGAMCRGTQDACFELLPTRRCVMLPDCVQSRKSGTVSCPAWSCVIQRTVTRRSVVVEWWIAKPNRFQLPPMNHGQTNRKKGRLPPSKKCKAVMAPSHHRRPAKRPSMPWYPARAAVLTFWQTRRCNASEEQLPTEHLDFPHCLLNVMRQQAIATFLAASSLTEPGQNCTCSVAGQL